MAVELSETLNEPLRPLSPPYFAESKPSPMGAGLANLGNTCFLNAVLQCFTHTVPLVQSLRSCDHANPCRCDDGGFCVFCALREHVELSLSSSGGIIEPLKLVENLSHLSSSFQRFQQEDAHEFLQCMLDRLSSCVESSLQDKPSSSHDNSFVKQIFGGRLRSQLRCCQCGHYSDTLEPLIDLSLEIECVDTLSTALESFTQVEKIGDSETKFTCENCKEEVLVEKQLTIDQAPAVAVLHLKRFKSDGLYVEKINEFVKYPLELDLQPFISNQSGDDNEELKYDLYAVLVHIGISSSSGHYFCFIRSSPDSWHRLDDTKVVSVSEDYVLNQEAYVLFYKRQGSPWFLSLMEAQKTCLDFSNTSPRSVLDDTGLAVPSLSRDGGSGSDVDEATDAPLTPPPKYSSPGVEVEEDTDAPLTRPPKSSSPGDEAKEEADAPLTPPPKSSSPDILPKEPTVSAHRTSGEVNYQIPHVHLNQGGWKKPPNKVLEDGRAKQSLSRLLRGMPNSRSSQLLACITPRGCQSEGSLNPSKRRRMSQLDTTTPRNSHEVARQSRRWNIPQTVIRSLEAGDSNLVVQFDSL